MIRASAERGGACSLALCRAIAQASRAEDSELECFSAYKSR